MKELLSDIFKTAIQETFGAIVEDEFDPSIQVPARKEFGDYQANFAMRLGKILQKKPIDIASQMVTALNTNPIFKALEPSGPGFINIFLTDEFLSQQLQLIIDDPFLGIQEVETKDTVVIDYANANVAKEMHVGHLRSIVIGDAIVNLLEFLGYHVIRQSHLGDWGTQFGMLIEYLYETDEIKKPYSLSDLDALYKKSKQRFDNDPEFADKARARVVQLQRGDAETLAIWKKLVKESLDYFQIIFDKIGQFS